MQFKVVNQFGPQWGDVWQSYLGSSRLLQVKEFCSLDGTLSESVFLPSTDEDWENCINDDFMLDMITNLKYARKIQAMNPESVIFGFIIDPKPADIEDAVGLIGFDIIDGDCEISLVTNSDGFPGAFKPQDVSEYGLFDSYEFACGVRDKLRRQYSKDPNAEKCNVWAVYRGSSLVDAEV